MLSWWWDVRLDILEGIIFLAGCGYLCGREQTGGSIVGNFRVDPLFRLYYCIC